LLAITRRKILAVFPNVGGKVAERLQRFSREVRILVAAVNPKEAHVSFVLQRVLANVIRDHAERMAEV
jgi:hypothetical protein